MQWVNFLLLPSLLCTDIQKIQKTGCLEKNHHTSPIQIKCQNRNISWMLYLCQILLKLILEGLDKKKKKKKKPTAFVNRLQPKGKKKNKHSTEINFDRKHKPKEFYIFMEKMTFQICFLHDCKFDLHEELSHIRKTLCKGQIYFWNVQLNNIKII